MQAWTLFLVSIERGTSRRVYHRRPWLSDTSQLGGAPCRLLARPGCSTRRCRRTEAHNVDSTPASIAARKSRAESTRPEPGPRDRPRATPMNIDAAELGF